MAINQNHTAEELDGIKCAIVEKNVSPERLEFLRSLLEHNGFKFYSAKTPPPKGSPAPEPGAEPAWDGTFTAGVSDVTFNPINAIFGRLLHTTDGHVVTLAYWQQKEKTSSDTVPYFENEGR